MAGTQAGDTQAAATQVVATQACFNRILLI